MALPLLNTNVCAVVAPLTKLFMEIRREIRMSKIKPGKALWRQDVGDIPVEVIRILGTFRGDTYYEIEGATKGFTGKTGVPEKQLIQETEDSE
jgi:hypothetical protein